MARLGVYGGKQYVNDGMDAAIKELNLGEAVIPHYFKASLNIETVSLARGCVAIAIFVNDDASGAVIRELHSIGVRIILCMCAGFNMVSLETAEELGIIVARVPTYSPHAVAEFAVGMLMSLNRKIHRAFNRTRECNFEIEGLLGFDLYQKTVGVLGTGNIGSVFCRIMNGFGCKIVAYDVYHNPELAGFVEYKSLDEVLAESDVLSVFLPLYPSTYHTINEENIFKIKKGAFLVNVSRGGLIDTKALLKALKQDHFSGVALDVYEHESSIFYHDLSSTGVVDDTVMRLLSWPKVIISSHMAFFTVEAVRNIMQTTLTSLMQFLRNEKVENEVRLEVMQAK
mmetsp:Transcript_17666/g.17635  ORF Transcript_17666/g.17635 Transcript_17666/m.17635 type:complete len:341 (+) Transcript_17666:18-1040(+)